MSLEAYSSYHSTNLDAQTARASPVELVLVLTDGLLEELARARGHIIGKRYELKANSLNKCTEIINGLSSSLDFEPRPPVRLLRSTAVPGRCGHGTCHHR